MSGKKEQNAYIYGNSEYIKELSASNKEELLQLTYDMSLTTSSSTSSISSSSSSDKTPNGKFLKSGIPTIIVFYAPVS